MAALAEMNYRPNLQARDLVAGSSNTIGIIVSNLENPFFVDIFHALEKKRTPPDYEVLVGNTNYEPERLEACIDLFLGRRVAGLAIIVSEHIPPDLKLLTQAGVPIALYDASVEGKRRTTVSFDYGRGMTQLVRHLYDLGHRRMAYIGYPLRLGPTDQRQDAFIAATRKLKIKIATSSCVSIATSSPDARPLARCWTRDSRQPRSLRQRSVRRGRSPGTAKPQHFRTGANIGDRLRQHRNRRIQQSFSDDDQYSASAHCDHVIPESYRGRKRSPRNRPCNT